MTLSLRIDLGSTVPAYRQIVSALRALLVEGALQPSDGLPTVRKLAIDLGLNHNTVAEAYRILAEEGWLDLRRRHGVRVLQRAHPRPERGGREAFARRLRELVAEAQSGGMTSAVVRRELLQTADALMRGGDR